MSRIERRLLSASTEAALIYVYTAYLSRPYTDISSNRGSYVDEYGCYRRYPNTELLIQKPGVVYRPNHGLAHNVRVTSKVREVISLYVDEECNTSASSRKAFSVLNHPDEITKLEIVAAFYIAGRESEAGFSPVPNSPYQRYRSASSEAFRAYAPLLFSPDELELYSTVLSDPYFNAERDGPLLMTDNPADESHAKKAAIKAVLSSCHALDLARCFDDVRMNGKISEIIAPLGKRGTTSAFRRISEAFIKSEVQHILTGNRCRSSFDERRQSFIDVAIPFRSFLFQMASTYPLICMRLVSLSHSIQSIDQAKQLALILDRYAKRGAEALNSFLIRVEQLCSLDTTATEEGIGALLAKEKEAIVSNRKGRGRLAKTIRNDAHCFWEDFAKSLVDPAEHRPELRLERDRLPYTIRLNKGKYEVVSTDKKKRDSLHPNKTGYTRHQSTSYSNPEVGFNPPTYNKHRAEFSVGVSFSPKDCIFNRIMAKDMGTALWRRYDFLTQKEAEAALNQWEEEGTFLTSLSELEEVGLEKKHQHNHEVMAGFRWNEDGTSHVTVFSNNLESRLLAQVRALDLKQRLEKRYPTKTFVVPISIYPEYLIYTNASQADDREEAKKVPALQHYLIAMEIIASNESVTVEIDEMSTQLVNTFVLLRKTNKEKADQLRKQLNSHLLSKSNEFRRWVSDYPAYFEWVDTEILDSLTTAEISLEKGIDLASVRRIAFLMKSARMQKEGQSIYDAVNSFSDLILFFKLPRELNQFFGTLKQKLPLLIDNVPDLISALGQLNANQRAVVIRAVQGKLSYWVNCASFFLMIIPYLDATALKQLLDSPELTKKCVLNYCSELEDGFCGFFLAADDTVKNQDLEKMRILISHEKTKILIRRRLGDEDGRVVESVISTFRDDKDMLSVVLQSDYYETEDGIRDLQAALEQIPDFDSESRILIQEKLKKLEQPLERKVVCKPISEPFSAGELYNALTTFFFVNEDYERTWIHSILNEQGEEWGRLVFDSFLRTRDIIYFPGTDGTEKVGIPLKDIKKFVDAKLAEAHPDLDFSDAVGHYVLIVEENRYMAGVSVNGHLDIQGYFRSDEGRSYEEFQRAAGCVSHSYSACPKKMKYPANAVLASHYNLKGYDYTFPNVTKECSHEISEPDFYRVESPLPKYPQPMSRAQTTRSIELTMNLFRSQKASTSKESVEVKAEIPVQTP